MKVNYETTQVTPFGVMVRPASGRADVRELPTERMRELVRQHHLLVLRGFETFDGAEAFEAYCGGWGEISVWPFGKTLELIEHEKPDDHIFDNNYVPLHWDGMYRQQVPEFQLFHCVSAPEAEQGGRTTFSNTKALLERAAPQARALWSKVTGIYHRKMAFYDSKTIAPIVTTHPVSGFPVVRYNEPSVEGDESFVNRPALAFTGIAEADIGDFHRSLRAALYAPENFYAHAWQTGDVVISDNYTLLHGREGFTSGAPRHLRRVHVLGNPPLDNPHLVAYA
ncbi:TauD/TfdA dioxygenase family protein [Burkholderia stagnalis]|uniref:TauD/TfdA dioxygenase family protein n=2 Tax=Burkholderia stagnalis TaxID=1503054 RepID=UPI000A5CBFCD|nr:TauD/TfdA family dioxygenase [Burkholderia stagnalis]